MRSARFAEQNRGFLPAHIQGPVASDLFSRRVEGIDASLKVCRDHARTDRFDDALVQRTQSGERLRRLDQSHVRARLPLREARREQPDDEERHVVDADGLDRFVNRNEDGRGRVVRNQTRDGGQRKARKSDDAADGSNKRAARAQKNTGDRNTDHIQRDVWRINVASDPDEPCNKEHVREKLHTGL